ncbi:hypothetical protein AAF463_25010 (plasmid) [Pantoea sp. BJ2]|uniref:Uncharacterized protein n=1 Tax=Pantoea sp. BJ2 TaxID=3141322 RepID=A0AAU7U333_9GAMM
MTDMAIPFFSHSHHLLKVKDASFPLDVLSFEGTEALSAPFSWHIIFTSTDKHISREAMLLKPASLTLLQSPQSLSELTMQLLRKLRRSRPLDGIVLVQNSNPTLTPQKSDAAMRLLEKIFTALRWRACCRTPARATSTDC